jgi:uncharacterized membrane protein HdeD (DUF308 family)
LYLWWRRTSLTCLGFPIFTVGFVVMFVGLVLLQVGVRVE